MSPYLAPKKIVFLNYSDTLRTKRVSEKLWPGQLPNTYDKRYGHMGELHEMNKCNFFSAISSQLNHKQSIGNTLTETKAAAKRKDEKKRQSLRQRWDPRGASQGPVVALKHQTPHPNVYNGHEGVSGAWSRWHRGGGVEWSGAALHIVGRRTTYEAQYVCGQDFASLVISQFCRLNFPFQKKSRQFESLWQKLFCGIIGFRPH